MIMDFKELKDVSGQGGTTKIGTCLIEGKDVPCVEKTIPSKEFEHFVRVNKIFRTVLDRYGPHVFHTDEINNKVYMEYLQCSTVEDFMKKIDLEVESDVKLLKKVLDSVKECLRFMKEEDVCHGELHAENILACNDGSVKLIDIETMYVRSTSRRGCFDESTIFDAIYSVLTRNKPLIDSHFKEQRALKKKNTLIEIEDMQKRLSILSKLDPEHFELMTDEHIKMMYGL